MLSGKSILVTGGTGSFGQHFVKTILERFEPKRLIVYSRDELKQHDMQQRLDQPCMRYFLGDVRDEQRMVRAMDGVDIVVHAAALKQVVAAEYNPMEFVQTNVHGAESIIKAALANNVEKVIALSTDKAVEPINLYGATKMLSDRLFVSANNISGSSATRFAVVRYGNVAGSRGSVVPLFASLIEEGKDKLPITDEAMTRFWITLNQGVEFVINSFDYMVGGEVFVPKIPSVRIVDIAQAMAPQMELDFIGIRPGEKLHEALFSKEEAHLVLEFDDYYCVQPAIRFNLRDDDETMAPASGKAITQRTGYSSDNNDHFLSVDEIREALIASGHIPS